MSTINDLDLPTSRTRQALDALNGPVGTITIAMIAVAVAGLVAVGPDYFASSNITLMGSFLVVPILVGVFAGIALLAGVVDLSIGSMVGVSAAIFANQVADGTSPWTAAVMSLVVCALLGAVNATAIVVFGADPLAATLGTLTALGGIRQIMIGGSGGTQAFIPEFFRFTRQTVGPFPLLLLLVLAIAAVVAIYTLKSRIGRHIRAAGGDERAAVRAGISVPKIRFGALVLSALGAGVAGILYVGQLGGASYQTGLNLEFEIYAALMIGGFSILRGGIGNPVGGVLGLTAVMLMTNIFDNLGYSAYYASMLVGVLLLAAVFLDRLRGGESFE